MLGIGIDIEDINRFKKYSLKKDLDFLKTIYSENELEYCFSKKSPAKHLAVRFCAKEAFIKALPNFVNDIKFNEINIVDINYKKTGYAEWQPVASGLNSTVKLIKEK